MLGGPNRLDELRGTGEASQKQPFLAKVRGWVRAAFVDNAALKIVALVLALTVFILVHSKENEVYHPRVSITYSQEKDRVLVSRTIDEVQISVRGTRRRIQRLQKQRLANVRIDLGRLSSGDFRLEPSMFDLPDGVELISINPPNIYLEFDEKDEKMLPVTIDTIGLPAAGFKIGEVLSSPSQVRVSGARKVLAELDSIVTKKVNLTGRTQSFDGPVDLLRSDVQILDSDSVRVTVKIVEELQRRVLASKAVVIVPVDTMLTEVGRFRVEPQTVVITMYGETHALDVIDSDKVEVRVELKESDRLLVGGRKAELSVEPRLSDIAYKITPSEVTLTVKK